MNDNPVPRGPGAHSTNGGTPPPPSLDHGHDVLCISSIDWDFIWQGHQEIMSTLAAQGHRVLFLENTGVRSPKLSDLPRLRQRITNWWKSTRGFREERPNLFVYSPIVVPLPYSRIARWINRVLLITSLRRWMRAVGFSRPVIWTFLPTPLAHELIDHLDPLVTVYYCIDDLASSSAEARRITSSEIEMFKRANLVFVTSEKLRARAAEASANVHFFPFGVRFQSFEEARLAERRPPADIASLPRPIVGYVGGMHQWIDQDLAAEVARRLPHVTFVYVGPPQCDLSRLEACPNIVLLGGKPHSSLPSYIREFDIGIVPYRLSDYTSNVYPTKLNEYLSMGIPVVATDLVEIRRFNDRHDSVVEIAGDAAAFAAAIERTLRTPQDALAPRRIEIAKSNSWQARISHMLALLAEAAAARAGREGRWELRLKRAYRVARRRSVATIALLAVAYLLIFQTSLMWRAAEPLILSEKPQPADVIVVFAGGAGESGQAGGGYQERVKQAVDLYHQGLAPRMIFSTGFVFAFPEGEVMRQLAMANGVPPSAIILETEARNTYENVLRSYEITQAFGWKRVLLVSSPYHMRRSMLTWRKVAPGAEAIPTPVPASQFYLHDGAPSLAQMRGIIQEYAAIVLYWSRGWI
jgi:uncharacterized SAM-binding protein YcdF (DUF218 family)/glycosyltransferase involved in cell wall biosynthesis